MNFKYALGLWLLAIALMLTSVQMLRPSSELGFERDRNAEKAIASKDAQYKTDIRPVPRPSKDPFVQQQAGTAPTEPLLSEPNPRTPDPAQTGNAPANSYGTGGRPLR